MVTWQLLMTGILLLRCRFQEATGSNRSLVGKYVGHYGLEQGPENERLHRNYPNKRFTQTIVVSRQLLLHWDLDGRLQRPKCTMKSRRHKTTVVGYISSRGWLGATRSNPPPKERRNSRFRLSIHGVPHSFRCLLYNGIS